MIGILSCPFSILIYLSSIAVGLAMFFKPATVIEFQRRFYKMINWHIEPISMPKEIRNTKLMGLFLVLATPLAIIYLLIPR
ncbi:MAG: hypothetical protein PHT50_05635 [Candidatus Omnitrophica bacterium]|nr:hypothetical protein [Candidatus Omnitrophota bacterium]